MTLGLTLRSLYHPLLVVPVGHPYGSFRHLFLCHLRPSVFLAALIRNVFRPGLFRGLVNILCDVQGLALDGKVGHHARQFRGHHNLCRPSVTQRLQCFQFLECDSALAHVHGQKFSVRLPENRHMYRLHYPGSVPGPAQKVPA